MTDAHAPSPDDMADDGERLLLPPDPEKIETYLSNLEEEGFEIELAVVNLTSEHAPGSLTVQFWKDEHPPDEQEGDR